MRGRIWSVFVGWVVLCGAKPVDQLADKWQVLLDRHVGLQGQVSYQGFRKDRQQLLDYLNGHRQLVITFDDSAKKALYINLYNAFMIEAILRYCDEKKIDLASGKDFLPLKINRLKVEGGNIWNGSYKVAIAGQLVNLDNIEHDLIRGQASSGELAKLKVKVLDPRIHMAVNCAALSCPRLRKTAYRPATVKKMLEENINNFVNAGNQLQSLTDGKIKLNKIILWYYSDFEKQTGGAGSYLASFLNSKTANHQTLAQNLKKNLNNRSKLALRFSRAVNFFYNWQINDLRNYQQQK